MAASPDVEELLYDAGDEYESECVYIGTDYLHIKIYLIGVFGTSIAVFNVLFNTFFSIVFVTNKSLRMSPLYYFGILAILDILLALNYILLMSVPVYMDQFNYLWLYHSFLMYLNPMMTASNSAMFASMLLIFMATVERLLRTFRSENLAVFRKLLERCRPQVCLVCICIAVLYKLCTYFEIHYVRNENCTDWAEYEIIATSLAANPNYRFWWMFVARNLIDRIIPFFILVLINFLIIRTLKREHQRFSVVEKHSISVSDANNKKILRDATRALIALVSLYLMSQTLQVFTTFWEAFHRSSLEGEFNELYSYLNDVMSLMTLLSSTLRFPVYCACNNEINEASRSTLKYLKSMFFGPKTGDADYLPIAVNHGSKSFKPPPIVEVPMSPTPEVVVTATDDNQDSQNWFL